MYKLNITYKMAELILKHFKYFIHRASFDVASGCLSIIHQLQPPYIVGLCLWFAIMYNERSESYIMLRIGILVAQKQARNELL